MWSIELEFLRQGQYQTYTISQFTSSSPTVLNLCGYCIQQKKNPYRSYCLLKSVMQVLVNAIRIHSLDAMLEYVPGALYLDFMRTQMKMNSPGNECMHNLEVVFKCSTDFLPL